MDRRRFLRSSALGLLGLGICAQFGCRSNQTAEVAKPGDSALVGSGTAGGEINGPRVDGAVTTLLARHRSGVQPAAYLQGVPEKPPMRICFLGVENMTAEDLADIQAALYERINQRILNSGAFRPVSKRYVDAGLKAAKLRPVDVLYPQNMRILADHMEQIWQPFEFVLIAKLTSSPTRSNANNETEYLLTLEMVNLHNDQYAKESTTIVKTHASTWAKLNSLTPWG